MDSPERADVRHRFRLPVVAAIVLTALAIASAGASAQSPPTSIAAFLLDGDRYTTIEAPEPGVQAFPTGINDRGQIVGEYIIDESKESGFVRDKRGGITSFDVPGTQGTEATDINDRGQIVGTFSEDTPIVKNSAKPRGYLFDRGKFTTIDFPEAAVTVAAGLNNRGQVVGAYVDAQGRPHGYRWDKGRLTTIDAPASPGYLGESTVLHKFI